MSRSYWRQQLFAEPGRATQAGDGDNDDVSASSLCVEKYFSSGQFARVSWSNVLAGARISFHLTFSTKDFKCIACSFLARFPPTLRCDSWCCHFLKRKKCDAESQDNLDFAECNVAVLTVSSCWKNFMERVVKCLKSLFCINFVHWLHL